MAVTKKRSIEQMQAIVSAGIVDLGENQVQEALRKQPALASLPIVWHFIGHIQSNKTKAIANHFDWVHSVSREKDLAYLNAKRASDKPPLNICIEIKCVDDPARSGCMPSALPDLAASVAHYANLKLRGVMAIAPLLEAYDAQLAVFMQIREYYDSLKANGYPLEVLSMGMSGDWQAAIAAGATHLRIGSALFK